MVLESVSNPVATGEKINSLLVFNLRAQQKRGHNLDAPMWPMSRPTAYRLVKRVMDRAGIAVQQATGKGLRHGFGVAMVTAEKPLPMVGDEQRNLVMEAWGE